ncbi:hypothetical protein H6G97_24260 [Nostoc flagelliforme FACHB-838]|uniref:Uncharacterized protein n=1 Tax=Nostoc flagelliforme FACHB-838 TaxID=2692904 RepID=A0ABR8DUE7_9NOSO|nr:hypothetical protein [Nostoc flagelliforme]MBD2532526.1 hypothetical protein [Nostoc flagelliforme FACHB-838]
MHKVQKSVFSSSSESENTSQLTSRGFRISPQNTSVAPKTQQDIEDQAFTEQKMEANQLQLEAKYGTLTAQGQERLTVLQAKMDGLLHSRYERASQFAHNIANISFHRPNTALPIQTKPTVRLPREQVAHQPQSKQLQRQSLPLMGQSSQVQQRMGSGVIQRKELDSNDILKALSSISLVKKKLKQTQHLRRDDRDTAPSVETMRQDVEKVLAQYDNKLKGGNDSITNQAISVAVVLEAVARVIAVNELNDPALTPNLTMKLIELYRSEIESKLKKMDDKQDVLKLATALTADDPVSLYMHNELRLDAAAIRVQMMARSVDKQPRDFFDLLRQRFEIEMATYHKDDVKKRQDTGNEARNFSVKEATGEVSVAYLEKLFPGGIAQWAQPPSGTRNTLNFTPDATQKLDDLKAAVVRNDLRDHDPNTRTWKRPGENNRKLTSKQSAHLNEIEQQEDALKLNWSDDPVIAKLMHLFKLDNDSAANLVEQIKNGLKDLPITLTVRGAEWFNQGDPSSTIYQPGSSRRNTADYYNLLKKKRKKSSQPSRLDSVNYLGDYNDTTGQGRGENYGRFRNWKDQRMTGNLGFSDAELPSFAAVNMNWLAHSSNLPTQGFGGRNNASEYGKNSYGDTHFILKQENIVERLVYTATDHGKPRRDIYLAFCDFLLGDDAAQSQTGMKATKKDVVIRHIVNSLITQKLVSSDVQCFEVQIFGELNISKDVEKISVAPSVEANVQDNINTFCTKHSITFEAIDQPTEAVEHQRWFFQPAGSGLGMLDQLQNALASSQLPQGA